MVRTISIVKLRDDNWGRHVYQNVDTKAIYKEVDGVLNTTTRDGEPLGPVRRDLRILLQGSNKVGFYKGVKYELDGFRGYRIFAPVNSGFRPYAGNTILSAPQSKVDELLKQRIRYEINKYFDKGGRS